MWRGLFLPALLLMIAAAEADEAPKFADYPAAAAFHGRNAAPVLASRDARLFRTRIREGAREKPNFDGHFIVTTWGCGTDCESGAIIDAVSGKVVILPIVAGTPVGVAEDALHFDYRRDSRMIVMNGMIGEEPPMGSHYFAFDGTRLRPLKTIVRPERRFGDPGEEKRE